MPKVLVFNPSRGGFFEEKEVDDRQPVIAPLGGYIELPFMRCIDQTSVHSYDVSDSVKSILDVACDMAKSGNIRHISGGLFIAAITNTKKEMMFNLFDCDRSLLTSFSQELANIINQQERTESFCEEMSPQFIRQFEEADVIRRVRKADKLEMKDVLKAILYSQSEVGRLMLRYSISSQNIDSHCQE
jgi:ATP-dependent Clp protease ATP-binding subunit ClpA